MPMNKFGYIGIVMNVYCHALAFAHSQYRAWRHAVVPDGLDHGAGS
jgi:hypothetical protein